MSTSLKSKPSQAQLLLKNQGLSLAPGTQVRDYQIEGAVFLSDLARIPQARILADKPGMGKTSQAYLAAWFRNQRKPLRRPCTPIICPAVARGDWVRELPKRGIWPGAKPWVVGIHDEVGVPVKERKAYREKAILDAFNGRIRGEEVEHVFLIASYEMAPLVAKLAPKSLGFGIYDEAHYLANEIAKRTQACRRLISCSEKSALLTGTPITNRPHGIRYLLDTCQPGRWGGIFSFAKPYFQFTSTLYGTTIGRFKSDEAKEAFAEMIRPYYIQRDPAEIWKDELPPRIFKLVEVDANSEVLTKGCHSKDELETRLRRAVPKKIDTVVELALELDEPLIVFVYSLQHARDLVSALNAADSKLTEEDAKTKAEPILATGDLNSKKRDEVLEEWQSGRGRVLVCTIDAVQISKTLTRAAATIYADLDWSPHKMVQTMARTDPSRQQPHERRPVRYYFAVCRGGADSHVAAGLIEKIEDQQGVIGKIDPTLEHVRTTVEPIAIKERREETLDEVLFDLAKRVESRHSLLDQLLTV